MVKNQNASLILPFHFMSRCEAALKGHQTVVTHDATTERSNIYIFFKIISPMEQPIHFMLILKQECFHPPPPPFPGCSLRLQPCVTHLKSANYTHAQSLIEAVDIEQPAVVNYFFAILPGKATRTSVKQRSVSLKSIHPEPRALAWF